MVGGTYYYIESILYDTLIDSNQDESNLLIYEKDLKLLNKVEYDEERLKVKNFFDHPITPFNLLKISNEKLHSILNQVDPISAQMLHPNNRRKVIRSLQVYQQTGQRHSSLLQQQKRQTGASYLGGPLRFENCLLLNIDVEKEILNARLDARVDQMIEKGLIQELLSFHQVYNQKRIEEVKHLDYGHGIFQMIGFKEFHSYLIMSEQERASDEGQAKFQTGLDDMKRVTRKYAKKQKKWLMNRFLRNGRPTPMMFNLNGSQMSDWDRCVYRPSLRICRNYLLDQPIPDDLQGHEMQTKEAAYDEPNTYQCDICNRIIVGSQTWQIHLKSKKHKNQLNLKRKAEHTQELQSNEKVTPSCDKRKNNSKRLKID